MSDTKQPHLSVALAFGSDLWLAYALSTLIDYYRATRPLRGLIGASSVCLDDLDSIVGEVKRRCEVEGVDIPEFTK